MAQIYYYDPQSAGIILQSPQSDSTPWTLTLVNSPHLWSRHKKDGSRAGGRIPFPVFKLCRRQRSVWNSWDCSSKVFSLLAGSITEVGIKACKITNCFINRYQHDFACGVSILGIQNQAYFCPKVTWLKGNFVIF